MDRDRMAYWFAVVALIFSAILSLAATFAGSLAVWIRVAIFSACCVIAITVIALIDRKGAVRKKAVLKLACYIGYDKYTLDVARSIRRRLGVELTPLPYLGEGIFDVVSNQPVDLLIFDYEHAGALCNQSENSLVPLNELRHLIDEFPEPQVGSTPLGEIVPRHGSEPVGFPIRLGTNSLGYNRRIVGKHSMTGAYDLLFGNSAFTTKLYQERRIGIWARQSIIMGLISLWLGNPSPYELPAAKFTELCQHLVRLKVGIGKAYYGSERSFRRLQGDLQSGDVWLVPGSGEWLLDPIDNRYPHIDWVIPQEGALLWVESLGLTQRGLRKLVDTSLCASELIDLIARYFLSETAQFKFAHDYLFPAWPINYERAFDSSDEDFSFLGLNRDTVLDMVNNNRLVHRGSAPVAPVGDIVPAAEWSKFWEAEYADLRLES